MRKWLGWLDHPVVHPGPLSPGSHEAGPAQVRKVSGNLGLVRPENVYQMADAYLAVRQQVQQSQPGGVRQCLKKSADVKS